MPTVNVLIMCYKYIVIIFLKEEITDTALLAFTLSSYENHKKKPLPGSSG